MKTMTYRGKTTRVDLDEVNQDARGYAALVAAQMIVAGLNMFEIIGVSLEAHDSNEFQLGEGWADGFFRGLTFKAPKGGNHLTEIEALGVKYE